MVDDPPGRGLLTALQRTFPRPGRHGVDRADVPRQRRELAARLHYDLPARRVRSRRRPRRRPRPCGGLSDPYGLPAERREEGSRGRANPSTFVELLTETKFAESTLYPVAWISRGRGPDSGESCGRASR